VIASRPRTAQQKHILDELRNHLLRGRHSPADHRSIISGALAILGTKLLIGIGLPAVLAVGGVLLAINFLKPQTVTSTNYKIIIARTFHQDGSE
jgi:hypothetical protein